MIEYKRYQGKSYLIRKQEEGILGYEIHMLQQNEISGILPMQVVSADGEMQYWYEISGKHDLEEWEKGHKMGRDFLQRFLIMLQQTIRHLGAYLLSEAGICLDPKMIFLDFKNEKFYFCYIPYQKKCFEDSLRSFMEYYLQHMEHENQWDTQRCYTVYERCQGEHMVLEELIRLLVTEEKMPEDEVQEEAEIKIEKKETSFNKNVKLKKSQKGIFLKKKKQPEMQYVFEPEEPAKSSSNPTVFLGSETDTIMGELRYEGDGEGKNLLIGKEEFLIGNQKEKVDGVVQASTVSRIHAKISKEGNDYYIEDLNSTNGTYLNGKLLNYKEKMMLQKNDVVKFAREAYRFV